MVISILTVKFYLFQFQIHKVHSLFDLIPANSIELITDLINSENIYIKATPNGACKLFGWVARMGRGDAICI